MNDEILIDGSFAAGTAAQPPWPRDALEPSRGQLFSQEDKQEVAEDV